MISGQWYPGNMARAVNRLRSDLKGIDLVVELADARIPGVSRNPHFANLFKNKSHLLLLHKADRAEEAVTERWLIHFKGRGIEARAFSIHRNRDLKELLFFLKNDVKITSSSRIRRPLRLIFVGIPNVGKSTLINLFAKKAVVRTGNRPGITRGRQWIRILPGLEMLDTPGILWPRITEKTLPPLAAVGAIPAGRFDLQLIALWLIEQYRLKGKISLLAKKYRDLSGDDPGQVFAQIGRGQGCLISGERIDPERTAALLLRDFQAGALGRLTLEEPPL